MLDAKTFEFSKYSSRKSYEEIPLLTADGIVIPKLDFQMPLIIQNYINNVPTIAGSNRDEGSFGWEPQNIL